MKKNMVIGMICGWAALSGLGATWYVDGARPDDSGDGTGWGTAKRTIQAAVDSANPGDTVIVAPGIYGDGARITPGGRLQNRVVVTKDITLESRDGAEKTIILGACSPAGLSSGGCGPDAVRCIFMDRGILKGFTLTGGATGNENKEDLNNRGGGLYSPSPNGLPLVYDCIISNNAAIRGGGAYGGAFHRCRITHNRAEKNGAGARDSQLHNCLVVFNEGPGASFCYARPGGRNNGLFNCTVAYNTEAGLDMCSAFNTISVCNGEAFRLSSAIPSLTFVNCCLSSPTVLGSNNIVAAYARFADAAGGDFRLLENSPCLDAGSAAFLTTPPADVAGLTDFLGAPRVQGKAVDIGAVEGVVAGIAAVAIDPPQGSGTVSPSGTVILKNLPTQVVFTASAAPGFALHHFTLDGANRRKRRNTFTLPVDRPGGYSVSAVFKEAVPWNPRLTEAEVIDEPEAATPMEGRLENEPALRIEDGRLAWRCRDLGSSYFIEFWFRPMDWKATGGDAVELCRLTLGSATYVLSKVAGKSQIAFGANGEAAATYPVYAWDDAEWASSRPQKIILRRSIGWHHVSMSVAEKRLRLTIDGFPAREVRPLEVNGPLRELALSGNPGTLFTLPLLGRGGSSEPSALRQRFLALFLNETQMRAHLLTVPRMKTPPKADGLFSDKEWSGAARITGWLAPETGRLLPTDCTGYIGYDDKRLYLAVVAPASGVKTGAAESDTAFDLFLGPPFVSGEEPRRLFQFTGTSSGKKSQRRVLPSQDENWSGAWEWATAITTGQRVAEFLALFDALGLPKPAAGETWSIGIASRQPCATWVPPEGDASKAPPTAELLFDPKALVIRPGPWTLKDKRVSVAVGISGLRKQHCLTVGLHLYGGNDLLPTETVEKQIVWDDKSEVTVDMEITTGIHPYGRVALYVKDGKRDVYYHSAGFPVAGKGSAE